MIMDFNVTEQRTETDCGVAVYKMILEHSGISIHYQRAIRDLGYKKESDGVSCLTLSEAFEKRGIEAIAQRASVKDVILYDFLFRLCPVIVLFDNDHWCIFVEYQNEREIFWTVDPSLGLLPIPRKKFEKHFSGIAMILKR